MAAKIHKSTIWEDTGVSLMARVTGADGENIVQNDVQTITRKVFDGKTGLLVDESTLLVNNVLFNELRKDARWDVDSIGYNFRSDEGKVSFPTGTQRFRVEYLFVPAAGEQFFLVYDVVTRNVITS